MQNTVMVLDIFGSSKMGMLDPRGGVEVWSTTIQLPILNFCYLSLATLARFNWCVVLRAPHSALFNAGFSPVNRCRFYHTVEVRIFSSITAQVNTNRLLSLVVAKHVTTQ